MLDQSITVNSVCLSKKTPLRYSCIFNHTVGANKEGLFSMGRYYTYISRNGSADEESQIVWPGQKLVLLPPPFHDKAHVKSQDERHGYRLTGVAKVITNFFKNSVKRKKNTSLTQPSVEFLFYIYCVIC